MRQAVGPRGVLRCKASDRDDPTEQPRFGRVGRQTIEDTGPLTKKRMETIDDETSAAAIDFMKRQLGANKPFFCWMNTTRMHFRTHKTLPRRKLKSAAETKRPPSAKPPGSLVSRASSFSSLISAKPSTATTPEDQLS